MIMKTIVDLLIAWQSLEQLSWLCDIMDDLLFDYDHNDNDDEDVNDELLDLSIMHDKVSSSSSSK